MAGSKVPALSAISAVAAGDLLHIVDVSDTTDHATGTSKKVTAAELGLLQKATVTLTNAQIKALPTTPVEVVAAPGAGKLLVALYSVFALTTHAGDYTNINAAAQLGVDLSFGLSTSAGVLNEASGGGVSGVLAVGGPGIGFVGHTGNSPPFEPPTTFVNTALVVAALNGGSGDFTGGNGANTLKVTVYYVVVDL